jgi:hypothetical protein
VEVDGYQAPTKAESQNGDEKERLFPLWKTQVTVPQTGGTYDFEVDAN